MAEIAILGAGVTGVTAAYTLMKAGYTVDLYEQEANLGGLAASQIYKDSAFDRYYHFLCLEDTAYAELLQEIGLGEKLHWKAVQMGYYVQGEHYPFQTPLHLLRFHPLSFVGRIQYGIGALKVRQQKEWAILDAMDAPTYLQRTFGREAFETLWQPILKAKFGGFADHVSGAWIWARIHRVATSREALLWREKYGYLEKGTSTFFNRMKALLEKGEVHIFFNQAIKEINQEKGEYLLLAEKEKQKYSTIVSTLPLPILHRIAPFCREWLSALRDMVYMGVRVVVLILTEPTSHFFWVNVADQSIPFSVVVNYSQLDPRTDLGGHLLYVPYYLPPDNALFQCSDEQLFSMTMKGLGRLFPQFRPERVRAKWIFSSRYAQPVCGINFGKKVPPKQTPFPRFYLLEASQLYPRDRTIAGQIGLVKQLEKIFKQGTEAAIVTDELRS